MTYIFSLILYNIYKKLSIYSLDYNYSIFKAFVLIFQVAVSTAITFLNFYLMFIFEIYPNKHSPSNLTFLSSCRRKKKFIFK